MILRSAAMQHKEKVLIDSIIIEVVLKLKIKMYLFVFLKRK